MPSAALEKIRKVPFGRRFLLNFLYCHELPLFPDDMDLGALLHDCFFSYDASAKSIRQIENHVSNVITEHAQTRSGHSHSPLLSHGYIYRVVDYQSLIHEKFGLLRRPAVSRRGIDFKDLRPTAMHKLAQFVSEPGMVNTSRIIRGRMPFAWITPYSFHRTCFDTANSSLEKGEYCAQILALYYPDVPPLFMLRLGTDAITAASFRRPDAFDGFGGYFFKSRNAQDHSGVAPHGFTLSITALRGATPPYETIYCDGVGELVAYQLQAGADAACTWLHFFNPKWVEVDDRRVDEILIGRSDIDVAIDEAIRLIEDLV
jgi:hypothetical protein